MHQQRRELLERHAYNKYGHLLSIILGTVCETAGSNELSDYLMAPPIPPYVHVRRLVVPSEISRTPVTCVLASSACALHLHGHSLLTHINYRAGDGKGVVVHFALQLGRASRPLVAHDGPKVMDVPARLALQLDLRCLVEFLDRDRANSRHSDGRGDAPYAGARYGDRQCPSSRHRDRASAEPLDDDSDTSPDHRVRPSAYQHDHDDASKHHCDEHGVCVRPELPPTFRSVVF